MLSNIVIVHTDREFLDRAAARLRQEGRSVSAFHDLMAALDALETVELLITRVDFGSGKLNGIALARMARHKRPRVQALFVASPEYSEDAKVHGEFLPMPVDLADLVAAVERLVVAEPHWN